VNHERALVWADRHFRVLKADIQQFEKSHEGPLVAEPDTVRGEYVLKRSRPTADFPEDWVFQIGDTLHAIRVSLDYLAFSIVRPTTPKEIKDTAFPICRDPKRSNWGSLHTTKLPGLAGGSDVVKAFYDLQPCSRANKYGVEMLNLLDDLENIHKHRHPLALVPASPTRGFTLWGGKNFELIERFPPSTNAGAPIFKIRMDNPDDRPNANFLSPVRVCFDQTETGTGFPVVDTLQGLQHYVRKDVFGALAKFIKP